jgi:hypothetical protein
MCPDGTDCTGDGLVDPGDFFCECAAGWDKASEFNAPCSIDVDGCASDVAPCSSNGSCHDAPACKHAVCPPEAPHFTCACFRGFSGERCSTVDACLGFSFRTPGLTFEEDAGYGTVANCGANGRPAGFIKDENCRCVCAAGFRGRTCEEKVPCGAGAGGAACLNGGKPVGLVADGNCRCECGATGFKGDACEIPEVRDVDRGRWRATEIASPQREPPPS